MSEFDRRLRIMLGYGVPWWCWCARFLVAAFAVWTMSAAPGDEHAMGLGVWVLLVLFYYFYL